MGTNPKINCWEYKRCGREAGGKLVNENGPCPVSIDRSSDGVNSGKNGGRFCWAIAGTFCFGEGQGITAQKMQDCMECSFFWLVADEEEDLTISLNSLRTP